LQWHGAEVQSLPSDATILASSPLCANQSFRWGNQAYGIQFHTEINEEMLEAWSKIPQYAASLEQILGKQGAENLARDTRAALPRLRQTAQHLHRNFMTNLR
jgi:GMP synthase-like glutamine amidotransferase